MSDKPAECPREGCYPFTSEGDFWIWFNSFDVQMGLYIELNKPSSHMRTL